MENIDRALKVKQSAMSKVARLLMIPALIASMSGAKPANEESHHEAAGSRVTTVSEGEQQDDASVVSRFYPEVSKDKFEKYQPSEGVTVLNFDPKKLDGDGLRDLYGNLSALAGYQFEYEVDGQKYQLELTARPADVRYMFVVPESAGPSSYAPEGFSTYRKGFTEVSVDQRGNPVSGPAVSFVAHQAGDKGGTLLRTIATEACQSTVAVKIKDGGEKLSDEEIRAITLTTQEVWCNSFAMLYYLKLVGLGGDYKYYVDEIRRGGLTNPSGVVFPGIALDESEFNKLRLKHHLFAPD